VALRPGVLWHETSTGTNAIGTALAERRAVAVRGAEHYFDPHRVLSCYAAPIFDPQGQVMGGLDISGHANIAHTHALGMVRMAVDQIEHRFFDNAPADCEVLRVHSDSALLGTAREGVLVFRDRCLIAANRFGLGLLGLDWLVLGKQRFDELFTARPVQLNNITHLTLLDGRKLHVRSEGHAPTPSYPKVIGVPRQSAPTQNVAEPLVLDTSQQAAQLQAAAMLDADIPVLLQGETGVGKEVFARAIHQLSRWRSGPFVAVNCAALPAGLIESELFGYEAGAFTGARKQGSAGLLRQAQGGVLLLDEIGDMPLELQSRLLRVLQERAVSPLGGQPVALNFALICATHCDLIERVERKQFRADLYYRIAHHCITLPALRECSNRITLINELWSQLCAGALAELPDAVVDSLNRYTWPGNYRQLLGVLRRLKVLAMSRGGAFALTLADLPSDCLLQSRGCEISAHVAAESSAISLAVQQEHSMRAALQASGGNVSAAARRLGISRSTLYRRIRH
jgi:transcriptional regulator of acetoin/glycerol metabolism